MSGECLLDTNIVIALFANEPVVRDLLGAGTAQRYGEIKDSLRKKGRPLPENDIWIAAMAIEMELPLATRDAHFRDVDNLRVESW